MGNNYPGRDGPDWSRPHMAAKSNRHHRGRPGRSPGTTEGSENLIGSVRETARLNS